MNMECEPPVSPTGQYFSSSAMSLCILAVLESEIPIDDSQTISLLNHVFLPINPRFSSIMVADKKGAKKWKRVEVKLEEHIKVPRFPAGMSPEFYDGCFDDYLSTIALEQIPQNRPLWEVHIIKYATSNAAGNWVLKLHHSLGDGYSLMGALLSCLQRADNPSLPLTFPSIRSNSKQKDGKIRSVFKVVPRVLSKLPNTVLDLGFGLMKSNFVEDGRTPVRSGEDVQFRPITVTTLTFSLDQIKQIKAKLGVTINDVIVGAVFLGTRLYMQTESQEQGNAASTALVVLNTRAVGTVGYNYKTVSEMVKPNAEMPWGNHFTFLQVAIPKLSSLESSNPTSFVIKTHRIIKRKRNSATVFITAWLLEKLRKFRGPEAAARYVYRTMKSSSMAMSNLIGPIEQMALADHPIKGLYFTLVGGPEAIAVTMMSYVGKLRVAMRMEKGFMDPQKFSCCVETAFHMILKASN